MSGSFLTSSMAAWSSHGKHTEPTLFCYKLPFRECFISQAGRAVGGAHLSTCPTCRDSSVQPVSPNSPGSSSGSSLRSRKQGPDWPPPGGEKKMCSVPKRVSSERAKTNEGIRGETGQIPA